MTKPQGNECPVCSADVASLGINHMIGRCIFRLQSPLGFLCRVLCAFPASVLWGIIASLQLQGDQLPVIKLLLVHSPNKKLK